MSIIKLTLNGEAREFEKALTLSELITELKLSEKSVFIEYNREPLPRENYPCTKIKDGDNIEIVAMMAGG